MSLAAAGTTTPRRGHYDRGCLLGRFMAELTETERDGLFAMFAKRADDGRRAWSNQAIADYITGDPDYPGVRIPEQTVRRHREQVCRCVGVADEPR